MEDYYDSHDIPPELMRALYESGEDDDHPHALQRFLDLGAEAILELSDEDFEVVFSKLQWVVEVLEQRIREIAHDN